MLRTPLILAALAAAGDRPVEFDRDVRPILSETCYTCHGPDAGRRKADLRLDIRDGLFAARDSGTPVVHGRPDESDLIFRVESDEPTVRMPPPNSGKSLTPEQVAILRRWVEEGAHWKGHWAFEPIERPVLPDAKVGAAARNPIDRFIEAELERQRLTPSPVADRRTLIRRLSFDLTGLPPTPEEVEAFVNDARPDAYERLVDRLLASPHHGERLAQQWLDLVRYADTIGYHGDNHQEVWLYRDWVIAAFRANMPFDRFTVEQLAGDLLPDPSPDQRVASGYNRMLMTTREGGAQPAEYMTKYAADRVRNASTVWLGATLGCAECHDHKYDPFTTADFYRFAAFFSDVKETAVGEQEPTRMPDAEQAARLRHLDTLLGAARKQLNTQTQALDAALAAWEQARRDREARWEALAIASAVSEGGATLESLSDGSLRALGTSPERDTYVAQAAGRSGHVTALRLEVLPDPSLPAQGPGRADGGDFLLAGIELRVGDRPVKLASASDSHHRRGAPASGALGGDPGRGWSIQPRAGQPSHAVFALSEPLELDGTTPLVVVLRMDAGERRTIGRFRLSVSGEAPGLKAEPALPEQVEKVLAVPPDQRDTAERDALAAYYRTIAPELAATRAAAGSLQVQRNAIEAKVPTTLVTEAMPEPRTMRILPRGNWLDETGAFVTPATPAFLHGPASGERRLNRLDLARWIVAPENPLPARVLVNRLWQSAFGRGLVATSDDLGAQGERPSHPELLDWLAAELRESGWDVRHVLRLIVTSDAYRRGSRPTSEQLRIDPENRWLARQARFRLDAEAIRDNALAVSGLLAREMGGPPAKPYQPPGYWSYLNFPPREYEADHGDGLYRRGLYTYWCRTFPHPSLVAFDAPSREECTARRPRSSTPLQALVLLNDPSYVEAARVLAQRVRSEAGADFDARLDRAFRLALSRPPTREESEALARLYREHLSQYRTDLDAAKQLIDVGEWPAPAACDLADLAAFTSVARVVLNLNESITRY